MDIILIISIKTLAKSEYFTETREHHKYFGEINQSQVNVDGNICTVVNTVVLAKSDRYVILCLELL